MGFIQIINLQVVFNNILRRIWNLPFNSHAKIVHCVSRIESIGNLSGLFRKLSPVLVLYRVFSLSHHLFCIHLLVIVGIVVATSHLTEYSEADIETSDWIRLVRHNFGNNLF